MQRKGKQNRGDTSAGSSKPLAALAPPKNVTHPEHHHTLNHLQQVAAYYAVLGSTSALSSASGLAACRLQGEMVRSATALSRKAVIRMDTGVKRATCRRCDSVWLEGLTANVRNRVSGPHRHVVKTRCRVCGATQRRPAPDLVPMFNVAQGKKRQVSSIENRVQEETGKKKTSQRERRRAATSKRKLLNQSESIAVDQLVSANSSAPEIPSVVQHSLNRSSACSNLQKPTAVDRGLTSKLSRAKRRQQRLARLSTRASPPRSPTPAIGPIANHQPQQGQIALPSPSTPVTSTQNTLPESNHSTSRRTRPAQCPQLPHFNDRVQSSGWDHALTTFNALLSSQTQEPETETEQYAKQALFYWEKASRSRGDHILTYGVGKNGSLGPVLP